jgi:hypothetical protein
VTPAGFASYGASYNAYGYSPTSYGGYGSYRYPPVYGYAPTYSSYGAYGCRYAAYRPRAYGYTRVYRRPMGCAAAFNREVRVYAAHNFYHRYASASVARHYAVKHETGLKLARAD